MSYSSLHNHSHFSLLDGFATPREYLERAKEIGLKSFAITEHGNQYSWVYFDEIKKEYPEIKMIYGVEFYETEDLLVKDKDSKYFHLVVLAKNENSRKAINKLVTKSNFEGFYYKPRITIYDIKPYANDLIILSACLASKLSKEKNYNKCIEYINEYKNIFPHFYLEMQSHGFKNQELYNQKILQLSKDTNTPFVITTDSHAATKEDLYYQARHVQIAQDKETMSEIYEGCYLQSEEEIHEIMDKQVGYENVVIGLENTNKIADMIDIVDMPFQEPQLPHFPLPEEFKTNYNYLKHLLDKGWIKRKIDNMSKDDIDIRKERVKYELSVISQMDYEGYFLIVWDFINFAKNNNVMVGGGRGSGAGSLVCYLLGITDIDPIKYGLIFERFLNPERISFPDIDVDVDDREKVINYLIDKYGENNVCQIINFSEITPIVAIKDVARVLDVPYHIADKISKRFTFDTFEECIEHNPTIYEEYPEHKELFDIASKISGRIRHASVHAGGVGIVDTSINDYMGMKLGDKGEHVIQVDKKKIEEIGIVKFDILGVQTLGVIKEVMNDLDISYNEISINNPEFENDKLSYQLLSEAKTNGVFQVESQGMKDLLLRLKPSNLEELSAVIALFRPDTIAGIEDFIYYKNHQNEIEYIHEDMKNILSKSYGQLVYQEQLLDIVKVFGGRTYGGADKFRKGIGKKDVKLVQEEANKLYQEIIDTGYGEDIAKTISEDMRKKGGYLFNKSHSISYADLCLRTAYLKSHYPLYFFKALLNRWKDNNGKLSQYIVDALDFGIKVLPPDINKSKENFTVHNGVILFGLSAINGIGENTTKVILDERNKNGKFKDFNDFINRTNLSESQIVILVKAGAIPLKNKRKFLINYAKNTFNYREYKDVVSLPTLKILKEEWGIDTDIIKNKEERLKLYNQKRKVQHDIQMRKRQKEHIDKFVKKHLQNEAMWEFEALSIFITDNPFVEIYKYLRPYDEIENGNQVVIVGVISNVVKKKDRNRNQYAFVSLYSAFGIVEILCWASHYAKYQDIIKKNNKIAILCDKKEDKYFVNQIKTYDQWKKDVGSLKEVVS